MVLIRHSAIPARERKSLAKNTQFAVACSAGKWPEQPQKDDGKWLS